MKRLHILLELLLPCTAKSLARSLAHGFETLHVKFHLGAYNSCLFTNNCKLQSPTCIPCPSCHIRQSTTSIQVKATVSTQLNIRVHVVNLIRFSALINRVNSTLQVSSYKAASPLYSLPTTIRGELICKVMYADSTLYASGVRNEMHKHCG